MGQGCVPVAWCEMLKIFFQLRVLQEQSLVEQGDGNAVLLESWDGGLHDVHSDADA